MSRFLWGGSKDRKKMHLVGWNLVTLSCKKRGLRISRLMDLNITLISKWIYIFGNKRDSLWRMVACVKSGMDPSKMLPIINTSTTKSYLFNLTGSMLGRNIQISNFVHQGFILFIGNGLNMDFLSKNWTSLGCLKVIFPCIFAIVVVKSRLVANFGILG